MTDPEAKITRTKDRRTHLRGRENNKKRYLVQVSAFNMGLVMRRPCGFGAPRGLTALCPVLWGAVIARIRLWTPACRSIGAKS